MHFRLIYMYLMHSDDCVCIIWGSRNKERSTAQVNSVIHYYGIHSRANICCTTTKCGLILSHYTDFLFLLCFNLCQKELTFHQHFAVYITDIYKCHGLAWNEGTSDGYTLNKSTMGSLESIIIMPL